MIHILLAVQLALWSPVMCCCAIKGVLGHVTGIGGTTCELDGCSPRQQPVEQPSCCESRSGEAESAADANTKHCTCHERITDRIQIDTGGKVIVPALQPIALAMFANDAFEDGSTDEWLVHRDAVARAHPPPESLLSLRTLLLI